MAGIMPSAAAQVVDNAFMAIGYSQAQLDAVNYNDNIRSYCNQPQLVAVINYIRTDSRGGLPSLGCGIEFKYVQDITLDNTYGLIAARVCRHSEHFLIP